MKQKIVFWLLLFVTFFQNSNLLAQSWDKIYNSPLGEQTEGSSVVETPDKGFAFSGVVKIGENRSPFVIRTDSIGNIIWKYEPSDIRAGFNSSEIAKLFGTRDSGFILILRVPDISYNYLAPNSTIVKLDKNGSIVWKKSPNQFYTSASLSPDSTQIAIFNETNNSILLMSIYGDSLRSWTLPREISPISISRIEFGGDYNLYINEEIDSQISKMDTLGNLIWRKPIGGHGSMKRSKDGHLIIASYLKFDYDGQIIFKRPLFQNFMYYFDESRKNKNLAGIMNLRRNDSLTVFVKQDSVGHIIRQIFIDTRPGYKYFSQIIGTSDGGFIGIGRIENKAYIIKFNEQGFIYSNLLIGKIHIDSIQNCRQDISENGFANRLVSIEKDNYTRWGITDSIGNYEIQVDTGTYKVSGILPNPNWQFCTPSVSKQFTTFDRVDTVNFAAQATYYCPQLKVSNSTSGLRRCFESTYYIRYTNEGTQAAQNAYITLKLDSLLEYISATRPLSSRQGQTLRFDLGTVPIGFDDQFSVQVRVKCGDSTRLGQSLCTEARIFPDTICVPAPNWSGANIVVNGRCDRDSVRFLIQNIGTATSAPLRRKIVEDEIVFLNGLISVPANGSQTISVPANGKTWQLLVEQEPNNPLSNRPTAVVEGCRLNQNQPISTGFVNQFPTDDGSPTIDNVCSPIIGAFDPNDKEGLPLGYKTAHFIDQNQDIEYRIRFQNTGTDTAFTIVVRDTLSDFLDIASLKIGASSHRFNWTIDGKNVLVFRFENILLPDSFRNEAASHGFVKFKISQKKDVVLGTKIMNQADIYFDYNAPIRTNKTVHTIGKDFIINALQTISPIPNVEIKVYPNPFNAEATIEIQGFDPLSKTSNFQLFDALGRQIRSEKFEGNQFLFERQELPTGIYFFKIENGGRLVGTGKFLVK